MQRSIDKNKKKKKTEIGKTFGFSNRKRSTLYYERGGGGGGGEVSGRRRPWLCWVAHLYFVTALWLVEIGRGRS